MGHLMELRDGNPAVAREGGGERSGRLEEGAVRVGVVRA